MHFSDGLMTRTLHRFLSISLPFTVTIDGMDCIRQVGELAQIFNSLRQYPITCKWLWHALFPDLEKFLRQ